MINIDITAKGTNSLITYYTYRMGLRNRNKKKQKMKDTKKKSERETYDVIEEQMQENFLKYVNEECDKKIKEIRENLLNNFHKLLDESVVTVRRFHENPKDLKTSLEYYTKMLEIANMMRDERFIVAKSSGAHDWHKRFIRLRSGWPMFDQLVNVELATKEKELMVIIDELVGKHSELFVVPEEIYTPTVIYNCLYSMIEAIGHNQTTEERLWKIWAASHFAIHYQEDFQYLKYIDLDRKSQFLTPIHAVMVAQNRIKPILDSILSDSQCTKHENELCNLHLEHFKEFRRIFVSILIRK